jgi:hypothetical protein
MNERGVGKGGLFDSKEKLLRVLNALKICRAHVAPCSAFVVEEEGLVRGKSGR